MADRVLIRREDEHSFSEKIIRLPHTYQANDHNRVAAEMQGRSACGLPENAIVFCSFNGAFKLTPDMLDCWLKLLEAVDSSVLWLLKPEDMPGKRWQRGGQAAGSIRRGWSLLG